MPSKIINGVTKCERFYILVVTDVTGDHHRHAIVDSCICARAHATTRVHVNRNSRPRQPIDATRFSRFPSATWRSNDSLFERPAREPRGGDVYVTTHEHLTIHKRVGCSIVYTQRDCTISIFTKNQFLHHRLYRFINIIYKSPDKIEKIT